MFWIEKFGLKHPANFIFGPSFASETLYQGTDPFLRLAEFLRSQQSPVSRYDERSGTVTKFQNALVLQLGIRLGDRVVTNDYLFGECANAGELVSGAQNARVDGVADLLHELQVERLPGLGIEFENHNCTTVSVQQDFAECKLS